MNLYVGFVEPEVAREAAAQSERRFVRRPNLDAAVVVDLHGTSVRLDIAMESERRAKGVLENSSGFLKAGFEIAVGPFPVGLDVGQFDLPFRSIFVGGRIVVQDRRSRTNGFERDR